MADSLNRIISSFNMKDLINTIPEESFSEFLDSILNSDNINHMNQLLHTLYEKKRVSGFDIDDYYHYVMMFVYYEVLSLSHMITKINQISSVSDLMDYYKKICGFYPEGGNAIYREYFVRDYISNLYYGRKDILSYKDENNIKDEFARIWGTLSLAEQKCVYEIMNIDIPESGALTVPANFHKYFTRINDRAALCEENIEQLSYILNHEYYASSTGLWYIEPLTEDTNVSQELLLSVLIKIQEATINY